MNRRESLKAILAAGFAPAAIGSGVLMPVREILIPEQRIQFPLYRMRRSSDNAEMDVYEDTDTVPIFAEGSEECFVTRIYNQLGVGLEISPFRFR